VVPYRLSGKRGKNDAADAAAISEAVTRPAMRFVPLKSIEQQSQLLVHRPDKGSWCNARPRSTCVGPTTTTALVAMIGRG